MVIRINAKAGSIQSSCHVVVPSNVFSEAVGYLNYGFRVSHWPFVERDIDTKNIWVGSENWKISQNNFLFMLSLPSVRLSARNALVSPSTFPLRSIIGESHRFPHTRGLTSQQRRSLRFSRFAITRIPTRAIQAVFSFAIRAKAFLNL